MRYEEEYEGLNDGDDEYNEDDVVWAEGTEKE